MENWQVIVSQPAKRTGLPLWVLLLAISTVSTRAAWAQYPSGPQITKDGTAVLLQDYASLPLSSKSEPPINFADALGRVSFFRSEPANAPRSSNRFFVSDLNRNLYILDKTAKTFTTYINFAQVFPKFINAPSYADGLVTFAFDPDYAANGKLYTVHTEDPNRSGSSVPTNTNLPGLDLSGGYLTTSSVNPPAGTVVREAVLVEWTDTDPNNSTFEGTAREILRVGSDSNAHPMGDLLFNLFAQPGDADYRNLYIAVGDGTTGERYGATHTIPQRLDALQGKILRITPDINLRPGDALSQNGRYRIPTGDLDPNPFVSLTLSGLKKEIYAYGLRNPHRMSWDPGSNNLIVNDIGLDSWEEVNILTKGTNYGYAEREGTEQLFVTSDSRNHLTGSQTSPPTPFPDPDQLSVDGLSMTVTPVYPVAAYSHKDGDAISSGFVYRGSLIPQLFGKYIFGDITTARLFYADMADMIAKDDGDRLSLAAVHELQVVFDSPYDNPDRGPVYRRLFDIVADEYARKGGTTRALPGTAPVTSGNDPDGIPYGRGRADIRLAVGGDGEIYILSKSDGMIRALAGLVAPLPPTGLKATPGNLQVALSWTPSFGAASYNVKRSTTSGGPYAPIATGVTATSYNDTGLNDGTTYYYVISALNPAGESANSSEVSIGPPAAPTSLTLKKLGKRKVKLSWIDNATNEDGFYVQTSTDGVTWTSLARLAPSAGSGVGMSYTTDTLSGGLRYFRVQAFNGLGTSNGNVVSVKL